MSHITLRCTSCGAEHAADMATLRCTECRSPLDVRYSRPPRGGAGSEMPHPLHSEAGLVSLGEGNTPCIELPALGELMGVRRLYGKLEYLNPTGSFKDRGAAVMISVAREHGVTELVEDSSGNAGAAAAAYAGRAGIKAHIFAPADAPRAKLVQIRVYGAEVHLVEGPREAASDAAGAFCSERGLVYASHVLSPYFAEGTKSFAYEVATQLADGLPEHIVMPVGNGSLFIGAWKGFGELRAAGRVSGMPRLHCIQARRVMPLAAAFDGQDWSPKDATRSVAGGISTAAPARKAQVLEILKATEGSAVAVEDEEILHWQALLAEREGIYAEPTSAAAFAGLAALVRRGEVTSSDSVLVPVTGSGLKDTPPA